MFACFHTSGKKPCDEEFKRSHKGLEIGFSFISFKILLLIFTTAHKTH